MMKNSSFMINRNKSISIAMIMLLIISIFVWFCSADMNRNSEISVVAKGEMQFRTFNEKAVSKVDHQSKDEFICDHLLVDNFDNDVIQKIYLGSLTGQLLFKGLFFQLILLFSYLIFLYIKAWLILVSPKRFDLFLMHYIKLKDGKKNALSLCIAQ